MRPPPRIIVHNPDSPGRVAWLGSLLELCRGAGWIDDERRELYAALRSGQGWAAGGGAAPGFRVRACWTDVREARAA